MKHRLVPITVFSLLLGVAFDQLFYASMPGISVFIFSGLVMAATFYLASFYKVRLPRTVYPLVPLILFFSGMVAVRAAGFLIFWNIVAVMYLLLLFVSLAIQAGRPLKTYGLIEYISRTMSLPLSFLGKTDKMVRRWISDRPQAGNVKNSQATPVLRGIILSIPILILFVILFASADLVFQRFITDVFDLNFEISAEFIFRSCLVLFVAAAFAGAFLMLFDKSREDALDDSGSPWTNTVEGIKNVDTAKGGAGNKRLLASSNLGITEAVIVMGSVAGLFLAFVLIQITYLFGGHNNVQTTGLTYAEYARRGFTELIMVAVISLALILVLNQATQRKTFKHRVTFMWLSGALIIEVLVIMLSASRRLALYEEAYGLTSQRLYSHLFVGWLAIAFLLLGVHIMQESKSNLYAFQLFVMGVAFLAFLNLINPDAIVARRNIERLQATGKLDTYHLADLSDDAIPETIKLLDHSNEQVRNTQAAALEDRWIATDYEDIQNDWRSFNVSSRRAMKLLRERADQLNAHKDESVYPQHQQFW